jgi:hypothetical protein
MHLQVCLPQALPRAVGEGRNAVRGEAEQRRHVGGRLLLDLGLPEDRLPPFGQLRERLGRHRAFEACHRGVGKLHRQRLTDGAADVGEVLREVEPLVLTGFVVRGMTQRRQQICAERGVRALSRTQRVQHPGEGLGHQVVGFGAGPRELAG